MFELKMNGVKALIIVLMAAACAAQNKSVGSPQARSASRATKEFAAEMQELRDSWVQEFNAGHAEKVAAFYAPEAVLMRWDGSVHGYDSILAEFQRSVAGGAHDYVVHSLHAERSGDLEIHPETRVSVQGSSRDLIVWCASLRRYAQDGRFQPRIGAHKVETAATKTFVSCAEASAATAASMF